MEVVVTCFKVTFHNLPGENCEKPRKTLFLFILWDLNDVRFESESDALPALSTVTQQQQQQ
jgi:hypothetical protein